MKKLFLSLLLIVVPMLVSAQAKYGYFSYGEVFRAMPEYSIALQEIMEKNLSFKQEAQRLLEAARRDAYLPLKEKLTTAVKTLGAERGYALILNTDNDACPYLDPATSEDVTPLLKEILK